MAETAPPTEKKKLPWYAPEKLAKDVNPLPGRTEFDDFREEPVEDLSIDECRALYVKFFDERDLAAGDRLAKEWTTSHARVDMLHGEKVHWKCASMIRETSSKETSLAMSILARMAKVNPLYILKDRSCAISVTAGFVSESDEVRMDACWILCEAARREYWKNVFELSHVYEQVGRHLFNLCCALEGPFEVVRSEAQSVLVAKMFELCWRLRSHRLSKGFQKLHELRVRKCVLTAAISYIKEKRSYEDAPRHYLDGKVSGVYPSGADCAMRTLLGFCEIDFEAITKDDDNMEAHRRLSRCADAGRHAKALMDMNDNEHITVNLLITTAMQEHLDPEEIERRDQVVKAQWDKINGVEALKQALVEKEKKAAAAAATASSNAADGSISTPQAKPDSSAADDVRQRSEEDEGEAVEGVAMDQSDD